LVGGPLDVPSENVQNAETGTFSKGFGNRPSNRSQGSAPQLESEVADSTLTSTRRNIHHTDPFNPQSASIPRTTGDLVTPRLTSSGIQEAISGHGGFRRKLELPSKHF